MSHRITDKITAKERIEIEQDRLDSPFNSESERKKIRRYIKRLRRLDPNTEVNMIGLPPGTSSMERTK